MNPNEFTYDRGYRSSDSETALFECRKEEVIAAIEAVIEKSNHFKEIIARDEITIVIRTMHFNKVLKRVVRVNFISTESEKNCLVMCTTMNSTPNPPKTALSRMLIVETYKELGMEEKAKEFSKQSNKNELKSFGKGIAGGAISLVKMIIAIFVILLVIGIIKMIF